jgi:hypothetical protein
MKHVQLFDEFQAISEALKTKCQTPDAQFHFIIKDKSISVSVDLPMSLDLSEADATLLEANLHNAVELVLRPYFKKD